MEIIKKNKNNENEVLNEKDFIEFNKNNGEYKIFATVTSGSIFFFKKKNLII